MQKIWERRSYLCENINHLKFLVTVHLGKKYLFWFLLNKQKKCVSLSEVSKILRKYEKPVPLIWQTSTHNTTQRSIIPRKASPWLDCYYLHIYVLFHLLLRKNAVELKDVTIALEKIKLKWTDKTTEMKTELKHFSFGNNQWFLAETRTIPTILGRAIVNCSYFLKLCYNYVFQVWLFSIAIKEREK